MALIAYLQFGGDDSTSSIYNVCDYHYHATRPHNNRRPDGDARCERITFTVYVPQKSDPTFYDWFIKGESLSGGIYIQLSSFNFPGISFLPSQSQSSRTIYFYNKVAFTDAVCESMTESYSASAGQLRKLTISIVATKVEAKYLGRSSIKATKETAIAFSGLITINDLNSNAIGIKRQSDNTYLLESFQYDCLRARNYEGIPYGAPETATLDFTIKLENATRGNPFYTSLTGNQPITYSFLFDTKVDEEKYLHQYEFGIVVKGYVIDVQETYDKTTGNEGTPQMMLMSIKLLIAKILFIKEGTVKNSEPKYKSSVLTITND